jgi:hypothetical protein
MIDREHDLSITKQAEALNISRGSVLSAASGIGERPGGDAYASGEDRLAEMGFGVKS